jgi:hypothetical protein
MKHSHLFKIVPFLLVALVIVGCGTNTPPAVEEPTQEPEALPLPEEAEATVFVTGGSVAGTAFWGNDPLPGALIELRADDWRVTGDETAVAEGEAGVDGQFVITDVPAGEWSVVARWPEGELSAGGTPVVTVSEGQGVNDVVVRLERAMTLLEPDLSQPGGDSPTIRWEPIADIDTYRVMLIDMGTTEAVVQEMVNGDSLTVAGGLLQPSRRYTLVISGMSADETQTQTLANFTGEYVVAEAP